MKFKCPSCDTVFETKRDAYGRTIKCKRCNNVFKIAERRMPVVKVAKVTSSTTNVWDWPLARKCFIGTFIVFGLLVLAGGQKNERRQYPSNVNSVTETFIVRWEVSGYLSKVSFMKYAYINDSNYRRAHCESLISFATYRKMFEGSIRSAIAGDQATLLWLMGRYNEGNIDWNEAHGFDTQAQAVNPSDSL